MFCSRILSFFVMYEYIFAALLLLVQLRCVRGHLSGRRGGLRVGDPLSHGARYGGRNVHILRRKSVETLFFKQIIILTNEFLI